MPDCEIRPATSRDIPAILELQERNLRVNGGALSVRFSREFFEKAISEMPIVIARNEGQVVGYVVSTPRTAQAHDPIVKAMLDAYAGTPGAYNYGPICVAKEFRGRGLALVMFEQLKAQLPGLEGFTFIRADNESSISFHTKMGMREVAEFVQGDTKYIVVAYMG